MTTKMLLIHFLILSLLFSSVVFAGGAGGGGGADRPGMSPVNYVENPDKAWVDFSVLDEQGLLLEKTVPPTKGHVQRGIPVGCYTTYSTVAKAAAACMPGANVVQVYGGIGGFTCQCRAIEGGD